MKLSRFVGVVLVVVLLSVPGLLSAQEVTRGAILVRVEDATGAVIPGAEVSLVSRVQPTLRATTGTRGEVLFSALIPADDYSLSVRMQGFKTAEVKDISVGVDERRTLVITMEPGVVTQVVEVVGAEAGIDFAETSTGGAITDTIYHTVPLQRGINSAFFLAPGVTDGGGTCGGNLATALGGCANPSIGGASGLDNLYLLDGVNVTNQGFGGFGVTTRVFGSLGSGTTTSFIKEVEVVTGGYDAKYGQALGGIVNVITKSGGNEFHGAVFGYYSPNKLEAGHKQPNRVRTTNFQGTEFHGLMNIDFGFEVGGFILKDRLFFFGSLNPVVSRVEVRAPQVFDVFLFGPGDCNPATGIGDPLAGCANLGSHDIRQRTINYAFKLSGQINPNHRVEASLFGDPTIRKFGPNRTLTGSLDPVLRVPANFSRLDFSNLNFALRYNGVITPKWLINAHFSNNHNRFEEQELLDVYRTTDFTGPVTLTFGGLGFFENSVSDDKTFSIDNTNIFSAGPLGEHEFTLGFSFSDADWRGLSRRTGPNFPVVSDPLLVRPQDVGKTTFGGDFQLFSCLQETGTPDCFGLAPPAFQGATDTFVGVQVRGEFLGANFDNNNQYIAAYAQDNWRFNRYLTLKLGLRWEQEEITGNLGVGYVFTNSWGPRIGIIFDPRGDRRTKVQFSFARFFDRIPNDLAQRIFSGEQSYLNLAYWVEPSKIVNPDQAHYIGGSRCPSGDVGYVCDPATGLPVFAPATFSGSEGVPPAAGTKMAFQDEFVFGVQHEFANGMMLGGRYIDRRLKRATEDSNAITIEEADGGLVAIPFILINPSANGDFFTNPSDQIISFTDVNGDGVPDNPGECFSGFFGGTANVPGPGLCWTPLAGAGIPDGLPDGLPDAIREYQAVEIIFERRMLDNWQFFANWRISSLRGNYEGSFRNDNGQTDPSLTSLFDFTQSPAALSLYDVGSLPNDRAHVVNAYGSYMVNEGLASGLNIGFGMRVTSGKPITELLAHPLFANAGEIPCSQGNLSVLSLAGSQFFDTECFSTGRGGFGQTKTIGTVDLHADYPIRLGERFRVKGSIDFFNLFNAQRAITTREFRERTVGLEDPDFNTPSRLQRPFNVRFAIRLEW